MRKNTEIYPELGSDKLIMHKDLKSTILAEYPDAWPLHKPHQQTSWFVGAKENPKLVAHCYARDIKKLSDLWYFRMVRKTAEKPIIMQTSSKSDHKHKIVPPNNIPVPIAKFVRLGRVKALAAR